MVLRIILRILIGYITQIVGVGQSFATYFHQQANDFVYAFTQNFSKGEDITLGRRQVIQNFCTNALANGLIYSDETETNGATFIYDPRQSVFLFILCNHVGAGDPADFSEDMVKSFIVEKDLGKFGILCTSKDIRGIYKPKGCAPGCELRSGQMNSCDFSLLLPKIFTKIMNDLSNSSLAMAYGLRSTAETQDINQTANEMFFGWAGSQLYTSTFPEYPETHKHLKSYIQHIRKLIQNKEIIDIDAIINIGSKKKANQCNNLSIMKADGTMLETIVYDIFACPYSNTNYFNQDRNQLAGHLNVMYNELFRYQLFADYYSYMLSNTVGLYEFELSNGIASYRLQGQQEASRMQQEASIAKDSIKVSLRMITNIQQSFPIHIGFRMYYESLFTFRNALAKTYTPIHQFYYKLRNVQAKMY